MQYVYKVADSIAENMQDYKVVVNKSTVPIGTATEVANIIRNKLKKSGLNSLSMLFLILNSLKKATPLTIS